MRIVSQVFFEMNLYVMILVKIGVIRKKLFGGTLFLQPTHQRVFIPTVENLSTISKTAC